MLTITDAAGTQLTEIIDEHTAPEDIDTAVRFMQGEKGLEMTLDKPREGDTKVEHDGRVVVVLEEMISQALEGKTLGGKPTEQGQALFIE